MAPLPIWIPDGKTMTELMGGNGAVMMIGMCKDLTEKKVEMFNSLCYVCEENRGRERKKKRKQRKGKSAGRR